MTKAEDAANAAANERMLACDHSIAFNGTRQSGGFCVLCGGQFALMLLPRLAIVVPISDEE